MPKREAGAALRNAALDIAAVASFCLTLWLAFGDKASSATVTGLMAVGFAALRYLPLIDTIEAFGLKAKLRQTVNEADDLLAGLRTATATASKLTYFQLAYIGRMASPTWDRKRELLGQVDVALAKIGETAENVSALREPVLRFLLADIYYLCSQVVSARVEVRRKELTAEQNDKFGGGPIDQSDVDYQRISKARQSLGGLTSLEDDLMGDIRLARFADLLTGELERTGLPEEDLVRLRPMALRFGVVGEAAWTGMTLTDEALAIAKANDGYLGWKPFYIDVFQQEP